MPILLTTPLDTGDIDVDYGEVTILEMNWNAREETIRLLCQYGNTVSGSWVPGKSFEGPTKQNPCYHNITGADYTTMLALECSETPLSIYAEVKTALYQYLIDEGIFVGTIV